MRITVDQQICIGSGLCVLSAQDVFDQRDGDGIVVLLKPSPPADRHDVVRTAATACPVGAITVEEA